MKIRSVTQYVSYKITTQKICATGIHIFKNIHKSQYNRKPREEVRKIKN